MGRMKPEKGKKKFEVWKVKPSFSIPYNQRSLVKWNIAPALLICDTSKDFP